MANRKQRQRQSRDQIARIHTQTEISRKLHRAHDLAFFLHLEMLARPCGAPNLWLSSVLDYIADDIGDIQRLLNQPDHTA